MDINSELSNLLRQLGLTYTEILVYLNLIDKANSTSTQISKAIQLPRTTVTYNINSLLNSGLINQHIKGKRKVYSISSPKILQGKIDEQIKKYTTLDKNMVLLIKEIESKRDVKNDPISNSRFLESEKQIEGALMGSLITDEIIIYGNTYKFLTTFHNFFNKLINEVQVNTSTKLDVFPNKFEYEDTLNIMLKYLSNKVNVLPATTDPADSTFFAYSNRLILVSYQPFTKAIFINQADLYYFMRSCIIKDRQ